MLKLMHSLLKSILSDWNKEGSGQRSVCSVWLMQALVGCSLWSLKSILNGWDDAGSGQ